MGDRSSAFRMFSRALTRYASFIFSTVVAVADRLVGFKLDAGTDERIMLVSRDEQSVLVVTYKDVKACVASAFAYVFFRYHSVASLTQNIVFGFLGSWRRDERCGPLVGKYMLREDIQYGENR